MRDRAHLAARSLLHVDGAHAADDDVLGSESRRDALLPGHVRRERDIAPIVQPRTAGEVERPAPRRRISGDHHGSDPPSAVRQEDSGPQPDVGLTGEVDPVVRRHDAREAHRAPGRRDHRRSGRRADVDAPVLAPRVRMVVRERERPQHGTVHRPGPGRRRRRNDERRRGKRTQEQPSHGS